MSKQLDMLRELKSVTFASVENGKPRAGIIDVMLMEDVDRFYLEHDRMRW